MRRRDVLRLRFDILWFSDSHSCRAVRSYTLCWQSVGELKVSCVGGDFAVSGIKPQ